MSSWLRAKEQKKINSIETIHDFVGFMHSGSDDYSKLTKLLSKILVVNVHDASYKTTIIYTTHKEYIEFLESCYRNKMNFANGFNIKETTIKFENNTYIINTKGTIKIFDKKFNFNKIAELDETFTITTDDENLINSIHSSITTQFIQFLF
jgi:hypothetical protein